MTLTERIHAKASQLLYDLCETDSERKELRQGIARTLGCTTRQVTRALKAQPKRMGRPPTRKHCATCTCLEPH